MLKEKLRGGSNFKRWKIEDPKEPLVIETETVRRAKEATRTRRFETGCLVSVIIALVFMVKTCLSCIDSPPKRIDPDEQKKEYKQEKAPTKQNQKKRIIKHSSLTQDDKTRYRFAVRKMSVAMENKSRLVYLCQRTKYLPQKI